MLEVLSCGAGASVQDAGRFGFRRFGVAGAGAMDMWSLARANLLVGNPPGHAGIELALAGARFRVVGGAVSVAVAGPGAALTVGGLRHCPDAAAIARPGDEIALGPARGGQYTYLAVAGGLRIAAVLGSRAFHRRSGIGGIALCAGVRLPCMPQDGTAALFRLPPAAPVADGPFRVVPGPQDDHFTRDVVDTFLSGRYRVTQRSDRMGLILDGPRLNAPGGHDIVSDGVVPGCVQVPGDGRPIVLMRDCQTTGGYPKIATVISADLDRLAQCAPGAAVSFRAIALCDAVAAARQRAGALATLAAQAQRMSAADHPEGLLTANLISGVTDGRDG